MAGSSSRCWHPRREAAGACAAENCINGPGAGGGEGSGRDFDHKPLSIFVHLMYQGRGAPSIMPVIMCSRAQRKTRRTSEWVVRGLSLKDSTRQ
jgi:hypothetical protein